jgi:cell division protein FtsB
MRPYTVLLACILALVIGVFVGTRVITPARQKLEDQIRSVTLQLNQAAQRTKELEGRVATLAQENEALRRAALSPTPALQPPGQELPTTPTPTPV